MGMGMGWGRGGRGEEEVRVGGREKGSRGWGVVGNRVR